MFLLLQLEHLSLDFYFPCLINRVAFEYRRRPASFPLFTVNLLTDQTRNGLSNRGVKLITTFKIVYEMYKR